jgi:hypothetical protein
VGSSERGRNSESRGRKEVRNCQYQKSSIKRDSGGEDWTELDCTQ